MSRDLTDSAFTVMFLASFYMNCLGSSVVCISHLPTDGSLCCLQQRQSMGISGFSLGWLALSLWIDEVIVCESVHYEELVALNGSILHKSV